MPLNPKQILFAANLQKQAIDEAKQKSMFAKQQAEAQAIADQSKADINAELMKRSMDTIKSPSVSSPGAVPKTESKTKLTDLILPIMGAIAGGMFLGPVGVAAGLGIGTHKSMEMKQDRDKTAANAMMEQNKLSADQSALDVDKWFKEQQVKNFEADNALNQQKAQDDKDQFTKIMEIMDSLGVTGGLSGKAPQQTIGTQPNRVKVDLTGD